jgi:hypothetical protein
MIAFAIARAKRILLTSFPLPVTGETLERLGAERAVVILREGAMDMIVDFSAFRWSADTAFAELGVTPSEFEPLAA